ncbi:anti-sigma factor [Agrococcus carbonis]|uniref:Regulator of SigK n=1 Tax=Agrococcus carbonis TaxID=684552 RepID=A0A1H1T407_9MICO|nr:anti-sigma factor [Agrococcus carbonis]SDS54962.1 Anti-sigma-K factor rskA [Agrococcus carbonis]
MTGREDDIAGGPAHEREVDGLAAAYALDALTPEERARFEAEASPAALREAALLAETATHLADDEVPPPASLRAGVLGAIRAEPQLPAEPTDASATAPPPEAPASTAAAPPQPERAPGPAERRARARWRPMRVVAAIAAGAALLAGGIAIGAQLGDGRQEALGAVVAASDAQRSEIELADGGTATVIWSQQRAQTVLLFDGLPAAPSGSTYQAWYIDAAGPRSAGTFEAAGASTAVLLEGRWDAGVAVGVTVEPEGGSEAPTTEPFLVVQT